MSYHDKYADYKWIKIKKCDHDIMKSDFDNYVELEKHHVAETTFLIDEVRKLADLLDAEIRHSKRLEAEANLHAD